MPEPLALELGTGPVSWGVDYADAPENPAWEDVLDGIAAAGYRWTELGPLGYLPSHVAPALAAHGLGVTAGFVFEPLHVPTLRRAAVATARDVAERVAALGGRFLVIIDAVSPRRARTAGRSEAAPRLDRDGVGSVRAAVGEIAAVARDNGLRPVLHPHAGTHVEFEDEIEPLLDLAELCLDTGHCLYAGADPVAMFELWADRIPYLHLKDIDLARREDDFWASVRAGAFRPLGHGDLDLGGLIRALERAGFSGWATVEQDRVPGGRPVADLIASREAVEALL
jgi:inosose dehydratase